MNLQLPWELFTFDGRPGLEAWGMGAVNFAALLILTAVFWQVGPGPNAYTEMISPVFGARMEFYERFSPDSLYLLYSYPIGLIISVIPGVYFWNKRLLPP